MRPAGFVWVSRLPSASHVHDSREPSGCSRQEGLSSMVIYELRKVGRISPKGTEDITGDMWRRPPLAAEGCK